MRIAQMTPPRLIAQGTDWRFLNELKKELKALGREDILIVVGGVIPPQDFDALRTAGAAAIFPPGTVIADSAIRMLELLDGKTDPALTAAE